MNEKRNDGTIGDLPTLRPDGAWPETDPRETQKEGGEWQWNPSQTIGELETVMPKGGKELMMLAGRYKVVRRLGEGGMGSVWLAEDTKLDNRRVAVKMLPAVLAGKKGAYRQVKQEALMAMKLSHPNIATVRAFEEDEGGAPFLVMDYIEGTGLDEILSERGPLGEAETVKLLGPVAAALDYAHSQGVVHRDVKPGNVMVRKDGTPFVLDFGIAREIQETMTRVTGKFSSGTLLYMSPEQLHGRTPTSAQDVYSFAAMAYECLKGEPPFAHGVVEYRIDYDEPEPLEAGVASAALRGTIMAGLAKDPRKRPGSCTDVLVPGSVGRKDLPCGPASNQRPAWNAPSGQGASRLNGSSGMGHAEAPPEKEHAGLAPAKPNVQAVQNINNGGEGEMLIGGRHGHGHRRNPWRRWWKKWRGTVAILSATALLVFGLVAWVWTRPQAEKVLLEQRDNAMLAASQGRYQDALDQIKGISSFRIWFYLLNRVEFTLPGIIENWEVLRDDGPRFEKAKKDAQQARMQLEALEKRHPEYEQYKQHCANEWDEYTSLRGKAMDTSPGDCVRGTNGLYYVQGGRGPQTPLSTDELETLTGQYLENEQHWKAARTNFLNAGEKIVAALGLQKLEEAKEEAQRAQEELRALEDLHPDYGHHIQYCTNDWGKYTQAAKAAQELLQRCQSQEAGASPANAPSARLFPITQLDLENKYQEAAKQWKQAKASLEAAGEKIISGLRKENEKAATAAQQAKDRLEELEKNHRFSKYAKYYPEEWEAYKQAKGVAESLFRIERPQGATAWRETTDGHKRLNTPSADELKEMAENCREAERMWTQAHDCLVAAQKIISAERNKQREAEEQRKAEEEREKEDADNPPPPPSQEQVSAENPPPPQQPPPKQQVKVAPSQNGMHPPKVETESKFMRGVKTFGHYYNPMKWFDSSPGEEVDQ